MNNFKVIFTDPISGEEIKTELETLNFNNKIKIDNTNFLVTFVDYNYDNSVYNALRDWSMKIQNENEIQSQKNIDFIPISNELIKILKNYGFKKIKKYNNGTIDATYENTRYYGLRLKNITNGNSINNIDIVYDLKA